MRTRHRILATMLGLALAAGVAGAVGALGPSQHLSTAIAAGRMPSAIQSAADASRISTQSATQETDCALTIRVLTYNVCFGCMLETDQDKTALDLVARCRLKPGVCLRNVCTNIDAVDAPSEAPHLVGLQEASNWPTIHQASRVLREMEPFTGRADREEIAMFISNDFQYLWQGMGQVSGRPLQVAKIRHLSTGKVVVVVHVHNNHGTKGTAQCIQKGICNVRGSAVSNRRTQAYPQHGMGDATRDAMASRGSPPMYKDSIQDGLGDVAEDAVVICMGDWNDPDRRLVRIKPFQLCADLKIRDAEVCAGQFLPFTCCNGMPGGRIRMTGDYVSANRPTSNWVAEHVNDDASDHLAARAQVLWRHI